MEKLPLTIKKTGYLFTQFWRDGSFSHYEQKFANTGEVHAYEAIRINSSPVRTVEMFGREISLPE